MESEKSTNLGVQSLDDVSEKGKGILLEPTFSSDPSSALDHFYTLQFPELCNYAATFRLPIYLAPEDVVNQAFIRIINVANSDKPPTLLYLNEVKHYVYTTIRNYAISEIRRKKPISSLDQVSEDELTIQIQDPQDIEDDLCSKEEVQNLQDAIKTLQPNHQRALVLSYRLQMKGKQAAKQMNISEAAYKALLFRARKALRLALANN